MGARSGAGARAGAGMRAGMEAGTGTGVRASKTALRILCKSSSEYLGILMVATRVSAKGGFTPEGPASWSDNLLPDSRGGKESRGATEGATDGATEGRSRRRRLRPRIEVILELISSKTLFQTGRLTVSIW